MAISRAVRRTKQQEYERTELQALRVLCDEQRQQITDLRTLVRALRLKSTSHGDALREAADALWVTPPKADLVEFESWLRDRAVRR